MTQFITNMHVFVYHNTEMVFVLSTVLVISISELGDNNILLSKIPTVFALTW